MAGNQIVQNMKLKQQIESAINDFKNPDLIVSRLTQAKHCITLCITEVRK